MVWQDIVLSIANVLFCYALIPQVYRGFKMKLGLVTRQTALMTSIGMYALCIAYFTLDLFMAFAVAVFTGTMWTILLIQSLMYKRPKN